MPGPLTQIKLPTDRVLQLRNLASALGGCTFSETIGALLKFARERGLVDHDIPSVQVNSFSDGIALRFDEADTFGFSFDEVSRLVAAIYDSLSSDGLSNKDAVDDTFSVKRRGNAIAISLSITSTPKMFTRDIAEEFAELLQNEVSKFCIKHSDCGAATNTNEHPSDPES